VDSLEGQVAERTAELVDINQQLNREIAERQQVEQALRESEERFLEIAGIISQFFFVRSANSGQFLYVNPAYEKMWGRTCESLYQNPQSWMEAVHPDDRELVLDSLREQFQGNSVKREYRIIRPDGQERWVVADISVVRDETGQLLRFVGLVEDISDRKQIEEELRESALREQAVAHVLQKMRQTLDIDTIFSATTEELRGVLNCDLRFAAALRYRVAIYRFNPDWSGKFVAESLSRWA